MKAKTILTLLLSLTMAVAAMAERQERMTIHLKDGSMVQFIVSEQKPVVRCSHGIMQVDYLDNAQAACMAFERDKVDRIEMGTAMNGNVNRDGAVDVADISSVISVMAGGAAETIKDHADVNGDGVVDVADISTVISIMASK